MLQRFVKNEAGVTAIEYGLIVAVLSLAIVGGISGATNSVASLFSNNADKFNQAVK